MPASDRVLAWQPDLPGVREVLHASFADHAYPMHTHDAWTLLIVDHGAVRYALDRHEHGATGSLVTLLPPGVPHDGRSATGGGFRKRVLYLDPAALSETLIGAAVDHPALDDPVLRQRVDHLHAVLAGGSEPLEAQSRLALIRWRLRDRLRPGGQGGAEPADPTLATHLRDLLDARVREGITLAEAAALLHAHPVHLVRAFSSRFGLPPHRYLTGRRVDLARRLLLAGVPTAEVATRAGFYDQPHLTRHFRRTLGVTPALFAAGARQALTRRTSGARAR
jgi:AraC-like DNA-binding protein